MIVHHRFFLLALMLPLLIFFDQLSKWWILEEFIGYSDSKDFIEWLIVLDQSTRPFDYKAITSFLNIVVVWNEGISFGLFHNSGEWMRYVLIVLALGISVFFTFLIKQTKSPLVVIAIILIIAGALSNVWDRIRFGAVADFIDFHVMGWHYPAFNLADSFIVLGVIGYVIHELFFSAEKKLKN